MKARLRRRRSDAIQTETDSFSGPPMNQLPEYSGVNAIKIMEIKIQTTPNQNHFLKSVSVTKKRNGEIHNNDNEK
jgi:hypothetical protein